MAQKYNDIYTHAPGAQPFKSILSYDRIDVDDGAVNDMNYYRHWGIFALKDEPSVMVWTRQNGNSVEYYIPAHTDADGNQVAETKDIPESDIYYTDKRNPRIGTKSLFNNVNAVAFQPEYAIHNNAPLLDSQEVRRRMRDLGDCSIKSLVEASQAGRMGRAVYDYNDFMFCKYLGQVSNNYLVTLRRFPNPAGDHINLSLHGEDGDESITQRHLPDVGRLVTWMGTPGNDMENILKYSVCMPYEELISTIESGGDGGGEGGELMGTIMNLTSPSYAHNVYMGRAGSNTIGFLQSAMSSSVGSRMGLGWISGTMKGPREEGNFGHIDRTKNYGPVDVIAKTHKRVGGEGGGLKFEQDINLVFDYELRSYDGINTRAAFLDLLANILAVTYVNGRFWKGMYMGSGVSQHHLFANLPIYNLKPGASFNDFVDAGINSLKLIGQELNGGKPITSASDILNAAINLGKNLLSVLAGGMLNKLGRPHRQAVNSLLNDAPVGLWHLTIGNPKHPIMSMGNMILDDVSIQHYGRLGMDDFPVGLRVSIKLKHAMPRDAMRIEHMYMMGDFRIYQPMDEHIAYMYGDADSLDNNDKPQRISSKNKNVQTGEKYTSLSQVWGKIKKVGKATGNFMGTTVRKAQDKLSDATWRQEKIDSAQAMAKGAKSKMRRMAAFGTENIKDIWISSCEAYHGANKIKENTPANDATKPTTPATSSGTKPKNSSRTKPKSTGSTAKPSNKSNSSNSAKSSNNGPLKPPPSNSPQLFPSSNPIPLLKQTNK